MPKTLNLEEGQDLQLIQATKFHIALAEDMEDRTTETEVPTGQLLTTIKEVAIEALVVEMEGEATDRTKAVDIEENNKIEALIKEIEAQTSAEAMKEIIDRMTFLQIIEMMMQGRGRAHLTGSTTIESSMFLHNLNRSSMKRSMTSTRMKNPSV